MSAPRRKPGAPTTPLRENSAQNADGGQNAEGAQIAEGGGYRAEVRWTTHGVPHITADDWGSLGFGQGWACARDRTPTIADHVLKVRGERARFLGAGPGAKHLHSDLGYRALDVRGRAEQMRANQPPHIAELIEGYAAGYNAHLAEHGTAGLPAWCRGAAWVRPLELSDLYALFVDQCLMGSGRNLVEYIGSAAPPGAEPAEPPPPPPPGGLIGEPELGSNGWAFGAQATGGPGMVMANPHFPWYGEGKLWECHLKIPGTLDVYGAALVGTAGVQIGFNDRLAWTHTFSRGHRFTAYKLELSADDPTAYRFGDEIRQMTPASFSVDVLGDDGEIHQVARTLWSTHHGPMLNLPFVGWSPQLGFTYRDANLGNDRFLEQVLAMDTAGSIEELREAFAIHGGLPWVNTLAADRDGRCWYIDSSPTPNLRPSAAERFVRNVAQDPITALLHSQRVALLDGSDPDDEWVDEPGAPGSGLVPTDRLPQLLRDDHVFNANDPYWLANAEVQLPEHSPMHGLHRSPVSARTRLNGLLVSGRGPVGPSGPDGTLVAADVETMLLGNHSLLALQLKDEVVARCRTAGAALVDGRTWDLAAASSVLDAWDGRFDLGARGAVLWREFLAGFGEDDLRDAGALWATPWDPDRPLETPAGLAPAPDGGDDPVAQALGRALGALGAAGIAPDAPLGDVQWAQRGTQRLPVSGGWEPEGVANVSAPVGALARADIDPEPLLPPPVPGRFERSGLSEGGYPITYGVSFVMVAALHPQGASARGLLVYGQSDLPDSPHHADQLEPFAAGELRPLLVDDGEIDAATIERRILRG